MKITAFWKIEVVCFSTVLLKLLPDYTASNIPELSLIKELIND